MNKFAFRKERRGRTKMLVKSIPLEGDESLVDGGSSSQGSLLSLVTRNIKMNRKKNMKCRLFWVVDKNLVQ